MISAIVSARFLVTAWPPSKGVNAAQVMLVSEETVPATGFDMSSSGVMDWAATRLSVRFQVATRDVCRESGRCCLA